MSQVSRNTIQWIRDSFPAIPCGRHFWQVVTWNFMRGLKSSQELKQQKYCAPDSSKTKIRQIVLLMFLAAFSSIACAATYKDFREIERQLNRSSVEAANRFLTDHWETKMAALLREVEACNLRAIRLSVRLLDTTNLEALAAHRYSLEIAMGECPSKVLPAVPISHISEVCAVDAYLEKFPEVEPRQTIDQRISILQKIPTLASVPKIHACIAAYQRERERYSMGGK
ncbi:hypothetical protein [Roseateles depolymerans]|uniref:hypothetical protein n=1 Tax=Roseateles depolymerans TaxID=76731 RepID=UPI0011C02ABC|nr:hypothetical protein [Roseateles depolymerans]